MKTITYEQFVDHVRLAAKVNGSTWLFADGSTVTMQHGIWPDSEPVARIFVLSEPDHRLIVKVGRVETSSLARTFLEPSAEFKNLYPERELRRLYDAMTSDGL